MTLTYSLLQPPFWPWPWPWPWPCWLGDLPCF